MTNNHRSFKSTLMVAALHGSACVAAGAGPSDTTGSTSASAESSTTEAAAETMDMPSSSTGPGSTDMTSEGGESTTASDTSGETSSSSAGTTGESSGGAVAVQWADEVTTPGCFTFSSPTILGAEAHWNEENGETSLEFSSAEFDALYTGVLDGESLTLSGAQTFVFAGEDWVITETFSGTVASGVANGEYHYTECNETAAPESCPADGGCEVTASFMFDLPM